MTISRLQANNYLQINHSENIQKSNANDSEQPKGIRAARLDPIESGQMYARSNSQIANKTTMLLSTQNLVRKQFQSPEEAREDTPSFICKSTPENNASPVNKKMQKILNNNQQNFKSFLPVLERPTRPLPPPPPLLLAPSPLSIKPPLAENLQIKKKIEKNAMVPTLEKEISTKVPSYETKNSSHSYQNLIQKRSIRHLPPKPPDLPIPPPLLQSATFPDESPSIEHKNEIPLKEPPTLNENQSLPLARTFSHTEIATISEQLFISSMKLTDEEFKALKEYGVSKLIVDGTFKKDKLESLKKSQNLKESSTLNQIFKKMFSFAYKMTDDKLSEYNAHLDFAIKSYTNAIIRSHNSKDVKNDTTKSYIKTAATNLQKMKSLQKIADYDLSANDSKISDNTKILLNELNKLMNASNAYKASHDYKTRNKTPSEIQSGIINGYTMAWAEKYVFRKPEPAETLIYGHKDLTVIDPQNKEGYNTLIKLFQTLHETLELSSKTFVTAFEKREGLVAGTNYIIKKDLSQLPDLPKARLELEKQIENLKIMAQNLKFFTNSINKVETSDKSIGNYGEFSRATFIGTLEKIQRELNEFASI